MQKSGTSVNVNKDEMEKYLGVLLMMGIFKLTQYRMYWPSNLWSSISTALSVDRFDKIKQFFHWSAIDSVVKKCRDVHPEERHSVDEQVIPTKCRSGLRQYLPKKPHKWGIKVWARCGVSGTVYDFEIYTGAETEATGSNEVNFGVGRNVVKRLVSGLRRSVGNKVYFDNYFSSVNLLKYLKNEEIWADGTIRADRLKGATMKLKTKKELAKIGRGSSDLCVDANSNISIVRWLDNGLVQLISNYVGDDDGTKARRWSTKEKKLVEISRLFIVKEYNKHMEGVDLCDMFMALYRIKLRSTKYYMHIVYYSISVSVVNGWLLYRRHCVQNNIPANDQMSLLKFSLLCQMD